MSYASLSPREREVLDLLMKAEFSSGAPEWADVLAEELGISYHRVKKLLSQAAWKYGVNHDYDRTVRLVYLRARELGLIQ